MSRQDSPPCLYWGMLDEFSHVTKFHLGQRWPAMLSKNIYGGTPDLIISTTSKIRSRLIPLRRVRNQHLLRNCEIQF